MFAADWCLPHYPPRSEIPLNGKVKILIHSEHKWPEKVVFGATPSRSTPAAPVSPESDVLPSRSIAQTRPHALRDAFAAMVSRRAAIDSNK
jgi:hypothetical protein